MTAPCGQEIDGTGTRLVCCSQVLNSMAFGQGRRCHDLNATLLSAGPSATRRALSGPVAVDTFRPREAGLAARDCQQGVGNV
jgi:hypothetical protein